MCKPEEERTESAPTSAEAAINSAISAAMMKSASCEEEQENTDRPALLGEIAKALPDAGSSALITNLLRLFKEFAATPDEAEKRDKVENFLDERIDRLTEVIENYSAMAIPPDAGEMHQKVLDTLAINYEALFQLKDIFVSKDDFNLKQGFDLLMEADISMAEIEEDLRKQVNEMVITTIL